MLNWNALIAIVITSNASCLSSTQPVKGGLLQPAVDAVAVLVDHAPHVEQTNEKNF